LTNLIKYDIYKEEEKVKRRDIMKEEYDPDTLTEKERKEELENILQKLYPNGYDDDEELEIDLSLY